MGAMRKPRGKLIEYRRRGDGRESVEIRNKDFRSKADGRTTSRCMPNGQASLENWSANVNTHPGFKHFSSRTFIIIIYRSIKTFDFPCFAHFARYASRNYNFYFFTITIFSDGHRFRICTRRILYTSFDHRTDRGRTLLRTKPANE